jgi:hypothetical protein
MTPPKAKRVSGAAGETIKETRKQARVTIKEARKEARNQVMRARIAAAKARAEARARAKSSGPSTKAVGAAGAIGLAAGYFLDPDSGKRRRHVARDRALGMIRRRPDRTRHEPAPNDQSLADAQ